jgi:small GTP-binding protein
VGKTALIDRLVGKAFKEEGQPTIGVDYTVFAIEAKNESVKLDIWDTGGRNASARSRGYSRNASGAALVFDLTQKPTFNEVDIWLRDLNALCAQYAYIVLVGNKRDMRGGPCLRSKRYGLEYVEASAKDGSGIADAFARLAGGIVRRVRCGQIPTPERPSKGVVPISATAAVRDGRCC